MQGVLWRLSNCKYLNDCNDDSMSESRVLIWSLIDTASIYHALSTRVVIANIDLVVNYMQVRDDERIDRCQFRALWPMKECPSLR